MLIHRILTKKQRAIFYQIMRCMQLPLWLCFNTPVGRTCPLLRPVLSAQFSILNPESWTPNPSTKPKSHPTHLQFISIKWKPNSQSESSCRMSATATKTTITMPAIPIRIKMLPGGNGKWKMDRSASTKASASANVPPHPFATSSSL